jgi:hypothetical protein
MASHTGDLRSVSENCTHVNHLGYASSEHARESRRPISNELWLTVGIAFLILAPLQWFLLR